MGLSKVIGFAAVVAALAFAATGGNSATAGAAKTCPAGYVHANLSWGEKCLKAGQYCKIKGDREYHRYHFHCHTGRLSRSAAGGNSTGSGCQPGYSPCLPRVADLNCSDIPASKKPIRVTGDDPRALQGWLAVVVDRAARRCCASPRRISSPARKPAAPGLRSGLRVLAARTWPWTWP